MSKSDEIATMIPLYRQFIARQRALAQRQADKLKRRPGRRGEAETAASPATSVAEAAKEVDIEKAS